MNDALLNTLETYYDAAPRPSADTEEVGPFTLFVRTDPEGWPYYARPRLGLSVDITVDDVAAVLTRQEELGQPKSLEWVHETTPSLRDAARAAGLSVHECVLMHLPAEGQDLDVSSHAKVLAPDDADLPLVAGAIHTGFEGTDEVKAKPAVRHQQQMERGLLAMVGAYDEQGHVVGGGSHGPRGDTTELTGIAVLPRARRQGVGAAITAALVADARRRGIGTVFLSAGDDSVARVYERVGFVRVGTACVAQEVSP
ncbi:MAG: GNAT family N-acetyltransferase [Nocardioides sp.]